MCVSGRMLLSCLLLFLLSAPACSDPDDFVALVDVIFSIPSGSLAGTITCFDVSVHGDVIMEEPETFAVNIATVNSNDVISTPQFRVRIIDDADGTGSRTTRASSYT